MPSPAAITTYLFGTSALVMGFFTLLFPMNALHRLDLPESATAVLKGNGLAAFAMGLYYNLAAWQNNRLFFMLSVPMRCLTAATLGNIGGQ